MSQPLPAALAFFSLGALFMGTLALLLFNAQSRALRWWAIFQAGNMLWLGLQGWAFAAGAGELLAPWISGVVHFFPVVFIAFALVDGHGWPDWKAAAVVALGALTVPLDYFSYRAQFAEAFLAAWHIGGWLLGIVLMLRGQHRGRRWRSPRERRVGFAVVALLLVVAPVALIGGLFVGTRMWFYAMPLLVVWIQALLFVGVARLRFYDIEVRAARSGELAAGAAEQERLAVVGELAASLAHEIRNPLTGVRSLAQRLAEEEIDEGRRQRYAGVILQETARVERLVSELLGLARRAPRPAAPAAATALDGLCEDLRLLLAARADRAGVRLHVAGGGLSAAAPREALAQALLNLLLNALAQAPAGSQVELLARPADGGVELLVRDQGQGVPPGERQRIWEPFHSGGDGTGLGLAVVRRLAREAGWSLAVGDAPGGGAEFRIRVPRPAARSEPVRATAAADAVPSAR